MAHRDEDARVQVEVPGYRVDIEREVDLIEEVARVHRLRPASAPRSRGRRSPGAAGRVRVRADRAGALVRAGLREVRPASVRSAEDDLALTGDDDAIAAREPAPCGGRVPRTQLLPGSLPRVAKNQRSGSRPSSVFEVGTVFRAGDPVEERRKVGSAMCGAAGEGWHGDGRASTCSMRAACSRRCSTDLGVADWSLGDAPAGLFHPGRSARILVSGRARGGPRRDASAPAEALDLDGRVAVAELELEPLAAAASRDFRPRRGSRGSRRCAGTSPSSWPRTRPPAACSRPRGGGGRAAREVRPVRRLPRRHVPGGRKSLAFSLDFRAARPDPHRRGGRAGRRGSSSG